MDKQKVQILLDVLSEVSANFLGAEDLIKERLKEISFREEIPVEEVIYVFFLFHLTLMKPCVFGVMVCCLLTFSIKK